MPAVDILELIEQASGNVRISQAARAENLNAIEASGSATLGLLQQSKELAADMSAQKLAAQKQVQDNTREIASAFGGNLQDETTSIIGRLGQVFRRSTLKSLELKEQVFELDSQDFAANPIAWIGNQFEADALEQEATGYDDQAETASSRMSQLNAVISSGAEAQRRMAETLTDDSIAQTLQFESISANMEIEKLKNKNATANVEAMEALQRGDADALNLELKKMELFASDESRKFARDRNAMAWEKHNEFMADKVKALELAKLQLSNAKDRSALLALELAAKQDAKKSQAVYFDIIKLGAVVAKNPLPDNIDNTTVKQMFRTKEGKARADMLFNIGLAKMNGRIDLGINAAESFQTLKASGGLAAYKDSVQYADTVNFLEDSFNSLFAEDPRTGQPTIQAGANRATVLDAHKNEVTKLAAIWASNAEHPGSLYVAPPLAEIASQGAIKATKFYEVVISPQLAANSGDSKFSTMLAFGEDAVASGDLSLDELVTGLSTMYATVPDYNNLLKGLADLRIPLQRGYTVQAPRFGSTIALDGSDETKLRSYLLERARIARSSNPRNITHTFTGMGL